MLDYLRWKDIDFGDEILTLTAYKGHGRNIKPKRWPVQMSSRLKKELLQLQLQRKNKNDDALVFEDAKVNLRKLWTAAYAEPGVPKGTRLFYQACRGLLSAIRGSVDALNRPPLRPGRRRAATLRNDYNVAPLRELACSLCRINVSIVRGQKPRKTFSEVVRVPAGGVPSGVPRPGSLTLAHHSAGRRLSG